MREHLFAVELRSDLRGAERSAEGVEAGRCSMVFRSVFQRRAALLDAGRWCRPLHARGGASWE